MPADFHLISLPLGDEPETLGAALKALEAAEPGETAFLPELLAWSARGSGQAFARLVGYAQERSINIVTTLNLAGDLVEDLPGAEPGVRYDAIAIFTRHGTVHVPQAKVTPQTYERLDDVDGPGIGVGPYTRLNVVRLDMDESIVEARFLIGSDLSLLYHFGPAELACDLLVTPANLPRGAEKAASRVLRRALEAGVAHTALLVNPHEVTEARRRPLATLAEEAIDAPRLVKPRKRWPSLPSLRSAFQVYGDGAARSFVALNRIARSRVPVPRSRWGAKVQLGIYPITVVL
jgi:hypothetical protein